MTSGRALLIGLVTTATFLLPGAPALAAGTARPVVTPAQAKAIVQAWQVTKNRANQLESTRLLTLIESGTQREIDAAGFRLSALVGYGDIPPAAVVALKVYVPRQLNYPASFLALVKVHYADQPALDGGWRARLFHRESHAGRWKLIAEPSLHVLPGFDVDKAGYLATLAVDSLALRPTALTTSWQAAENAAGSGGSPVLPWAVNSIWRRFLLVSPAEANALRVAASSTHLPPVCFASHVGAVCIATSKLDLVDSLSQEFIEGKAFLGLETMRQRYDWGGLAQGHYSSLHAQADRQAVIVIPRAKPGAQLQLIGLQYGPLSGTGVLSPP